MKPITKLYNDFLDLLKREWVLKGLFWINFLGSIYGFYWYRNQLLDTPLYLWLFIPDSPTASSLFAVALYFYIIKKPRPFLTLLACGWLIKYGLWAAVINTHYLIIGGNYTFTNFHLTLSHLGMALEGFLFLNDINIQRYHVRLLFFLMIISDALDYLLGIYPWLFHQSQWIVGLASVIILTIGINLYAYGKAA